MAHAASRATPSRAIIAPSPNDKATLILRHFPALRPVLNTETGHWECPSMTHPNVLHTITTHKDANGRVERRCDCPSTSPCTHLRLVERMAPLASHATLETIHYSYDEEARRRIFQADADFDRRVAEDLMEEDASFDRRWAGLMKSRSMPGGLA
jgi:hypothetical protein